MVELGPVERQAIDVLRGLSPRARYTRQLIDELLSLPGDARDRLLALQLPNLPTADSGRTRVDVRLPEPQHARFSRWCGAVLQPAAAIRAALRVAADLESEPADGPTAPPVLEVKLLDADPDDTAVMIEELAATPEAFLLALEWTDEVAVEIFERLAEAPSGTVVRVLIGARNDDFVGPVAEGVADASGVAYAAAALARQVDRPGLLAATTHRVELDRPYPLVELLAVLR